MKPIQLNGKTVALVHKRDEWKPGLDFLTPDETFIQAGTWWYPKNKVLKAHVHIPNERVAILTQEVVIVEQGQLRVDLYSDDTNVFHQEILNPGDLAVILEVGHGYVTLADDTKIIEVKNGPFLSVEKDKRLLKAGQS